MEYVTAENLEIVDLKVLVFEDGSSDCAVEFLAAHYSRFVEMLKNSGKGVVAKVGLEQASGDYVLIPHAETLSIAKCKARNRYKAPISYHG